MAKPEKQVAREKAAYQRAASQTSFLDRDLLALEPCPFAFKFTYEPEDGASHRATCDDWETAATFYRHNREQGTDRALTEMGRIFNEDYPSRGMVFAMGTHSQYPKTWLLVGVIRLDLASQMSFLV